MRFLAALAVGLLLFAADASAAPPACNAGAEGTVVYNKDQKLVQFCNGTSWIGMVAKIGGTGDTLGDLSCSNDEVPTWDGSAWVCGAGGGGLWTDSGNGYLTYTGTDVGIKIQSITGMAAPTNALADLGCSNNEILKWDGDSWECASDGGGTLPTLTSANIWVGNGSNAATAVAMSGDATLSNAGVLTIANNAIGSAEITDGTVANADLAGSIALSKLAVTGTANSSVFLRGDGTWAAPPSGADNLGNHTATQALAMGNYDLTGVRQVIGGFGAMATSGTLDWNDASNARAGSGYSLLYGSATNGPGPATYFHPFSFEYGTKDGSGNLTQLAVPYSNAVGMDSGFYVRGRYGGTWTTWRKILTENSSGNIAVTGTLSATTLSGSGASLTSLPAANLTGALPAISGANLTSLNANNLASGTVPAARLPAYTGDVTKAAGGTALTIASGAVDLAHLSATGTKDNTTFLRGDNTWATPASGGSVPPGTWCGRRVWKCSLTILSYPADGFTAPCMPIPAISISRSNASRSSVPGERDQWRVSCVTAPLG